MGIPISAETSWEKVVSWPWPWADAPVYTVTFPVGWTLTRGAFPQAGLSAQGSSDGGGSASADFPRRP